jgi:hypothetical protein
MGMEQIVTIGRSAAPRWLDLRDLLLSRGMSVQLRMIDGELAFPDEEPVEPWTELRIGTAGGMVTLRRESDRIRLVIWENADPAMVRSWNALTWAVAHLSGGSIEGDSTRYTAEEFAQSADLPEAIHNMGPAD